VPVKPQRLARLALLTVLVAAFALPAAPATASSDCPGQFLVYQPAPAGPVKLTANSYTIQIFNLSCSSASDALYSFLGHEELPSPWTANVQTKTFFSGKGSFFSVSARGAGQGPGGPPGCPAFSIVHADHVDQVPVPRGRYSLKPGGPDPLSCMAAARLLVRALDEPTGSLPGWEATAVSGPRAGATLRNGAGQTVTVRRLDGRTAGGGHTGPV
jgi:hypothetical protein